jgi:hypothetical protein
MESNSIKEVKTVDPMIMLERLVVGQCYAALDREIRVHYLSKQWPCLYDLIQRYAHESGDVCMLYHMCRHEYFSAYNGNHVESYDEMQKHFIFLLMRVFMDVFACFVIGEQTGDIYHLFRDKVKHVWLPICLKQGLKFSEAARAAIDQLSMRLMYLHSPLWVCYCTRAMLNAVGFFPYTVCFGNVDNRYDLQYRENARQIAIAKRSAFEKISEKINAIVALGKTDEEKWGIFLSLSYRDIEGSV